MSLPEAPRDRAGSIPAQKPTEGDPATRQSHTQKLYRSSLSSTDDSPSQPPTKNQPRLSLLPTESEKKEDKQQDQDNSSDETSSTISSNSNSSTHEKEELGADDDNMLSVENLSSSSSTSLAVPTGDVPALPAKSSLRASRLLATIPQKKTPADDQPMLPHAAPHQVYLSSEEDASSSADDFSDFDDEIESDSEGSRKASVRSITREDTARMVAVIFHGKPSIVTLSPRRSISPSSTDVRQNGAGLLRTTTEPSLQRTRSVSSTSSTTTFQHPPRSSSMMTGFSSKRPHFLQIDPYAKRKDEQAEPTKTPKTPTAMFRRTLSLVKKRSKQNLHQSESHITPMEKVGEVQEEEEQDPRESVCFEPSSPGPVNYQDIMRNAKRNASVSSPRSEAPSPMSPKNRFRTGLSLGRQRSVRA